MNLKISVVICTRDRHDMIGQAIESIAGCDFPRFDIHVVDQSTTDQTKRIVEALATRLADKCAIVYHHLAKAGLSRAYNVGMRVSDGELIACTDDDVMVPKDWLAKIALAFADDPDAGLLFGQVCVPESLSAQVKDGLIVPALTWEKRQRLFWKNGNFRVWGMGANMAIRRSLLERVNSFDEALGGGAALRSSQDFDFAYRTYRFGMAVLLEPDVTVDHYGTRTQEQWPITEKNYGIGDGAFYSKHIRCGDWLALRLFVAVVSRSIARSVYLSIRRGRYVAVTDYDRHLWTGVLAARHFSIDRQFRLYRENERARMTVTDSNAVTASAPPRSNPEHGR